MVCIMAVSLEISLSALVTADQCHVGQWSNGSGSCSEFCRGSGRPRRHRQIPVLRSWGTYSRKRKRRQSNPIRSGARFATGIGGDPMFQTFTFARHVSSVAYVSTEPEPNTQARTLNHVVCRRIGAQTLIGQDVCFYVPQHHEWY